MAKAHKPKNLPPGNAVARKKLSDLTQDAKNANKGTARGNAMIEKSLRDYGAGRSILLDKHGAIIAGNKTAQNAAAAGLDDVPVIKTDGRQLVAVQRIDLDLKDAKTRSLAITDNRANEVSLSWDVDVLKAFTAEGFDLAPFWNADELEDLWPQNAELQTDEDEVPAVPVEAVAKLGDLYILGDHRLLCGDSTVLAEEYASMPKQIIQDLFGGSGSTLIACEKTRRRCFMMELSPAYVDVIRIRWELATGKKAVLSV
jgi:sporulation protein YlmC with PRC-barrel domain